MVEAVFPRDCDQNPRDGRCRSDGGCNGKDFHTGASRGGATDGLKVDRHEISDVKEENAMDEGHDEYGHRSAVREELRRHGGFGNVAGELVNEEAKHAYETENEGQDRPPRGPGVFGAGPSESEEDGRDGRGERGGTDPVDPLDPVHNRALAMVLEVEKWDDEAEGYAADWQIDVENPAPGDMLGKDATENGADDRTDGISPRNQPTVLTSLPQRQEIADDDFAEGDDASPSKALDHPSRDEHRGAVCPSGQAGSQHEEEHGYDGQGATTEDVGHLSVDGLDNGGSENVGVGDPDEEFG